MDAALSEVASNLNGAEFLLTQMRAALAVSGTHRDVPPVAAYRASLEGSRSALNAVREAANVGRGSPTNQRSSPPPRAPRGDTPTTANARLRETETTPRRDFERAVPQTVAQLNFFWKGAVSFVRDMLDDPFLGPRVTNRSPHEALRDSPDGSEEYQVGGGYYPASGPKKEKQGRRTRRRHRHKAGAGSEITMSPVIEESSPVKDSNANSRRASPMKPPEPPELCNRVHARVQSTPPRARKNTDDVSQRHALRGAEATGASRVENETETLRVHNTLRVETSDEQSYFPLRAPQGLKPVATKSNTVRMTRDVPFDVTVENENENEASCTPQSDSECSDVGSETDGYKQLISKYAGVTLSGESLNVSVDEYFSDGTGSTPRASQTSVRALPGEEFESTSRNTTHKNFKQPPRDDVSARHLLFSTSAGGDARAPESDSWKVDNASYDPATSGRTSTRCTTEIEKELHEGVARLGETDARLADATRLASTTNHVGDALLASLRGQTVRLARNADALRAVGTDMEKNEKLMNDMSAWTRLGAKPRRRPWG
jgi:hypothetical protein|tara:strand:- start:2884 stop:4518 length:1635 start_codon:yes stop_codon:yes gene_type:complete